MSLIDVQIILPKRHAVFIPALSVIDLYYFPIYYDKEKDGDNYKIRMELNRFINYLIDKAQDFKYADKKELDQLKKDKPRLLYMYVVGQRISEWNFELMSKDDYIYRAEAMKDDGSIDTIKLNKWISDFKIRREGYERVAYAYLKENKYKSF